MYQVKQPYVSLLLFNENPRKNIFSDLQMFTSSHLEVLHSCGVYIYLLIYIKLFEILQQYAMTPTSSIVNSWRIHFWLLIQTGIFI